MNATLPIKLLAPMVLILGAALPAWAQMPESTAERVACYMDLSGFNSLPSNLQARFMTTDSLVNCPRNKPKPSSNIQVECRLLIGPGWPAGLKINPKNHFCEIEGAHCGLENNFTSDNTQLVIEPVEINGEVFGDAMLRCQNKKAK